MHCICVSFPNIHIHGESMRDQIEAIQVISFLCFLCSILPTWIDHVERDAIFDVWKAVPEILDEDEGDGELNVGDEEGHGDGSCPPKSPQHDHT